MCQRTCPKCGSTEHAEGFGITGAYIVCEKCDTILAHRCDMAAAPIDLTYDGAMKWAEERTFVLAGAEASDPADDRLFTPPLYR